ncbi:MAG: PAS domain-containing sensor histidine kinase [Verrucomicrobia bacterium]|nr:PAS domain-containing sensor histidine kinase [Verrucomicrobiota bacterium]
MSKTKTAGMKSGSKANAKTHKGKNANATRKGITATSAPQQVSVKNLPDNNSKLERALLKRMAAHPDNAPTPGAISEWTTLQLTESLHVGVYALLFSQDGSARQLYVNPKYMEFAGMEREECMNDPLKAFRSIHPDEYEEAIALNAICTAEKKPFRWEGRLLVHGKIRWVTIESTPQDFGKDGLLFWGVVTDITARKTAEQRLAASEAQLARILDNAPFPIVCTTLTDEQRVTFINKRSEETFGYTRGEIRTVADWAILAYPDETYRNEVFSKWNPARERAIKNRGAVESMKFRVRCKDGTRRDVVFNAIASEDLFIVCMLDITERKQAEKALETARLREKAVEASHREKIQQKLFSSLSASAVAHEINQPLASIVLNSRIALERSRKSGSKIHPADHILKNLLKESEKVVSTIEKMKVLMRNVQTDHKPVDLRTVVISSFLQLKQSLKEHRITLSNEAIVKRQLIRGDDAQIQLAVVNLIRNAIEAIRDGNTAQRKIRVELATREGSTDLIVGDSGPGWRKGIPKGAPLTTTKKSGTGIGLFIVGTAMKNHGGTVTFGISPLGGAEVRLRFPREKNPDPAS